MCSTYDISTLTTFVRTFIINVNIFVLLDSLEVYLHLPSLLVSHRLLLTFPTADSRGYTAISKHRRHYFGFEFDYSDVC